MGDLPVPIKNDSSSPCKYPLPVALQFGLNLESSITSGSELWVVYSATGFRYVTKPHDCAIQKSAFDSTPPILHSFLFQGAPQALVIVSVLGLLGRARNINIPLRAEHTEFFFSVSDGVG